MIYIDDFIDDPTLTDPDLDDFFDSALNSFRHEVRLFGLPLQIEVTPTARGKRQRRRSQ